MTQKSPPVDPVDLLKTPPSESSRHEERLLDQAVAESFPASDPISPAVAARMEPADVNWDENSTNNDAARAAARLRRNAPVLIALGTAAVALLAMRALRSDRDRSDND